MNINQRINKLENYIPKEKHGVPIVPMELIGISDEEYYYIVDKLNYVGSNILAFCEDDFMTKNKDKIDKIREEYNILKKRKNQLIQ